MKQRIAAKGLTLTITGALLVFIASASAAFVGLPANGSQVNNDGSAIDPRQSVGRSDLSAGSLAGAARVPWITFDQPAAGGGSSQVFVRAFKNGVWQDQGFPESLNNSTSQNATSPSIDFTGPNRTVPWVTWTEPALGATQIFASRFAQNTGQNGGQWLQEGRGRSTVPSLNINTNRNADLPALIGGTTNAGANPAPWITWQEFDGVHGPGTPTSGSPQIFVSHAAPIAPGCSKPTGTPLTGHNFCFQQVGLDRVAGPGAAQFDPSLNIDPTRSGIEADVAFTGPNDTVPWVVWYENSDSNGGHPSTIGLENQDMVFAAKAVADASGDGGFHWQVVGLGTQGQTNVLNNSGATHHFGPCAETVPAEDACSLNASGTNHLAAGNGAENPSVTAGTMVPGNKTTPWIVWDENSSNGGPHSVFVARLDAAGDHYDLLNNGQPISHSGFDSTRSDIVFDRNTPYVSWHETNGGQTVTVAGHFDGPAANPVFHIDTTPIATTPAAASDVRSPIASTCPADPFNGDGTACQGGAIGTPSFAFNAGTAPQALFAQAYQPAGLSTHAALGLKSKSGKTAGLVGSVDPGGAAVAVHFEYGPVVKKVKKTKKKHHHKKKKVTITKPYSAQTPEQLIGAVNGATVFGAVIANLKPGHLFHFRAVVRTDFGTFTGNDVVFKPTRKKHHKHKHKHHAPRQTATGSSVDGLVSAASLGAGTAR